jgi:hypothetical protein
MALVRRNYDALVLSNISTASLLADAAMNAIVDAKVAPVRTTETRLSVEQPVVNAGMPKENAIPVSASRAIQGQFIQVDPLCFSLINLVVQQR